MTGRSDALRDIDDRVGNRGNPVIQAKVITLIDPGPAKGINRVPR